MTDIEPATLIANPARAGTCLVDAGERAVMMEAAATLGFMIVSIELEAASDKHGLLDAFAAALEFPPPFGHNWDALADSLGDLSWLPAPGYMLLLDHPAAIGKAAPRDFATLVETLDDAARAHASAGIPFWAVITTEQPDPPQGSSPRQP